MNSVVAAPALLVSVALALFVSPQAVSQQQPAANPDAPALRLPDTVRPTRQSVALTLDPAAEQYSGVVEIDLEIKAATSTIWLNAVGLTVREAALTSNGASLPLKQVPGNDHAVGFSAGPDGKPVAPGAARLRIAFEGALSRRDVEGLFAQQEGDAWYAYTQFQPLGARRAFPSFDEPGFKIPWQVTLTVPESTSAFSNTPAVREQSTGKGTKTVVFAETQPLPSYLVAVAVGPFEVVDAGKVGRKPTTIRMLVPRGHAASTRWAVESTPPILSAFEEYFGLPYPYEKLDQVVIPMFPGAMENAGLITYGQSLLLQKPGEETTESKRLYVSIAAHELAHQWFGNLVTTAWWDDIWLNESFASWLGQRMTRKLGEDWAVDVDNVVARSNALDADSLSSARRVRQPIEAAHDIANAFDQISYMKGKAVLEMFETWLGEDVFRDGVRQYIRTHAGGNATFTDFTAALSKAAKRDVAGPFSSFLDQRGAPLVSVGLTCDGKRASVALSQSLYRPLGSNATDSPTWQLPVCFRYQADGRAVRRCTLLTDASATIELDAAHGCPAWIVGNDRFSGYYRTRYEGPLLARLLDAGNALTTEERVGTLMDVGALIRSGDVQAGEALAIASRFAADPNRHVVEATTRIVRGSQPFVPEAQRPEFASFVRRLYSGRAREAGWRPSGEEPVDAQLLRALLVRMAGTIGQDLPLAKEAVGLALKWLDDPKAIPPDMVETTLAVAARSGDKAFVDRLHAEVKGSKERDRRERLFAALSQLQAPEQVDRALALTLDAGIDPRESLGLLFAFATRPDTRHLGYEFVKAHYDELLARFPQGSVFDVQAYLPFIAEHFCDAQRRDDVRSFFEPRMKEVAGGPRNLAQAVEAIELCTAQRAAQERSVAAFLGSSASAPSSPR